MPTYVTNSPEETMQLGEGLARGLAGGTTVAFEGGLGAGKTTFCRGMARGLGSVDAVSSPTFTIANVYRGPRPFAHFDAWRVEDEDDLEAAGYYDYVAAGAVVAVEWSERVKDLLEAPLVWVRIIPTADARREITIEGAVPL